MKNKGLYSRDSTENNWAEYWSKSSPVEQHRQFNPLLIAHLESALGGVSGKTILEAGCGTALDTLELTRRGAVTVAYDYSPEALAVAHEKSTQQGTRLHRVQGNILQLPFAAGAFDAVFHAGVLEHFRDPRECLLEQRRVLKRAGILLVDVPQTYNLYTPYKARKIRTNRWFAGWETQFTITGLESLLESVGFELVGSYGYGYFPPIMAKVRWASSIGAGFVGRPLLPTALARQYEMAWQRVERTRGFLYFAQNIGVIGRVR